jgi:hypothetical protein
MEENPMRKRLTATLVCSALSLIAATGLARADTIGRYQCGVIGAIAQEPIGDRDGHVMLSFEYSCQGVDGLLKEAVVTAVSVSEWDGPKGTCLASLGLHRAPGGFAVGQLLECSASLVMKDGKPIGAESSGKTVFKFASGTLASLSGKTVKFTTKPVGVGRFELEFTD